MKICPFCSEEIRDSAIKCKHCDEFLDSFVAQRVEAKLPWYFRNSFIVFALLAVGPLALPLIWCRPRMSLSWKTGLTLGIIALSWLLFQVSMESLQILEEYFRLLETL